jgi:hypothetical protein
MPWMGRAVERGRAAPDPLGGRASAGGHYTGTRWEQVCHVIYQAAPEGYDREGLNISGR